MPAGMNTPTDNHRIQVLLLDDRGLFRTSLAKLLASEGGFDIAAECATSDQALQVLGARPVDVVLLDFDRGPEHAREFIGTARNAGYEGQFLIIAGAIEAHRSAMALKLGTAGIFLKSEAPERLIQAIRLIAAGALWVDQRIIKVLADQCLDQSAKMQPAAGNALEDREQKVLDGILGGLTNRRIADGMGITESSVKNVLQSMFPKTGVRTRGQLVRLALEGSLGDLRQSAG